MKFKENQHKRDFEAFKRFKDLKSLKHTFFDIFLRKSYRQRLE